jgi:hypothetical protein
VESEKSETEGASNETAPNPNPIGISIGELLVVLFVIAVVLILLLALVMPDGIAKKPNELSAKAQADVQLIAEAEQSLFREKGIYTANPQDLLDYSPQLKSMLQDNASQIKIVTGLDDTSYTAKSSYQHTPLIFGKEKNVSFLISQKENKAISKSCQADETSQDTLCENGQWTNP